MRYFCATCVSLHLSPASTGFGRCSCCLNLLFDGLRRGRRGRLGGIEAFRALGSIQFAASRASDSGRIRPAVCQISEVPKHASHTLPGVRPEPLQCDRPCSLYSDNRSACFWRGDPFDCKEPLFSLRLGVFRSSNTAAEADSSISEAAVVIAPWPPLPRSTRSPRFAACSPKHSVC